ncbi:unnamed protein product [Orchesella dallaii]|uniref:Uncharacterized protein n=1 Tax=Orchesella dallaii TaxID=48710 RepID=A0ABP1S028_9HEXA
MKLQKNECLRSVPGMGKVLTSIFGTALLIVTFISYYGSDWKSQYSKICESKIKIECPSSSVEYWFTVIVMVVVWGDFLSLVSYLWRETTSSIRLWSDLIYQFVVGIILIIAASFYINSAKEIEQLDLALVLNGTETELNLRINEKIAAGGMSIIQGLLYFILISFMTCALHCECLKKWRIPFLSEAEEPKDESEPL